jgi:RNA polymerase sigma-70 factor, ECF subfamily
MHMSELLPNDVPTRSAEEGESSLDYFIHELTVAQTSLRAYILASLGRVSDVADVLQRTNLSLWKNASSFRPGAKFMPWAITIAKYEILSYCRDRSRDRHVFPEDIAALMLETASEVCPDFSDRQAALQECLGRLPSKQHSLLELRYYDGRSISQIADVLNRTENAVKCTLVRVRRSLQQCIESRLRSSSV